MQLKNISDTYPCFLDKRAKWTAPHHQQILDASSFNALLLTDLATNLSSAPQVQQRDELGESVHDTTFTQLFGILSENVAGAKIGDDAWKFFNTSKYFNIKLLYNSVQPASNSPAIQMICLHVEQSSKQEHNPLLQSLDILPLSSRKYKLARITHLLSKSEQTSGRCGVVTPPPPLLARSAPDTPSFCTRTHTTSQWQYRPARAPGPNHTFFNLSAQGMPAKGAVRSGSRGHSWAFNWNYRQYIVWIHGLHYQWGRGAWKAWVTLSRVDSR